VEIGKWQSPARHVNPTLIRKEIQVLLQLCNLFLLIIFSLLK